MLVEKTVTENRAVGFDQMEFYTDQFGGLVAEHVPTGNIWHEDWMRDELTRRGKDGANTSIRALKWVILTAAANMVTCKDCVDCVDCDNCTNCTLCYDCDDCVTCVDCKDCDNCYVCINCADCVNLKGAVSKIGEPS